MIKVALLSFCFEDYTVELANALAQLVNLTLIYQEKSSIAYQGVLDPKIQVLKLQKPPMRHPGNILSMRKMMRLIREVQPDVLHVQETNDIWYLLTILLNRLPPMVTTIHDVFDHAGDRSNVFGSSYTRRIAFYRSQKLIVHSHLLKKALTERFHVPQQRVHVLPHGQLGSLYQRRVQPIPASREPHTLLFFGRIWPYKGLKYLLEAMPLIADRIPGVKLIIAGRGENLSSYFPQGYDHNRYEIYNDFISDASVVELFQRSTVAVLPYVEASQSGVAALAYGMGTPVVASNVGGLSEIVHHNQDGLLVPPCDVQALADAVISLLSDRDRHQQMQSAAFDRCQSDLNWFNIAAQTVDVYYKMVERVIY